MDIFLVLGQRLKEQRKVAGLTQEEAAAAAGVVQTYVSNLENGYNNPGALELLYSLAEQYDTSIDYLFGRSEQRALIREAALSEASQEVMALLPNLPEHRRQDAAALISALIEEEKRRFAFWQVIFCADCRQPMTGYMTEAGTKHYVCEASGCNRHLINEEEVTSVILDMAAKLAEESNVESSESAEPATGFMASIRNLGRRLGLARPRQDLRPEEAVAIVRTLLAHEDRSITQAWLQKHFRIYVTAGAISQVELL